MPGLPENTGYTSANQGTEDIVKRAQAAIRQRFTPPAAGETPNMGVSRFLSPGGAQQEAPDFWTGTRPITPRWGAGAPITGTQYAMPETDPEQPQYEAPQTFQNLKTGEKKFTYVPPDYQTTPAQPQFGVSAASSPENLRFRNVPSSLGGGQYVVDVTKPGEIIRSKRGEPAMSMVDKDTDYFSPTEAKLRKDILAGAVSSNVNSKIKAGYQIDHDVPLWIGGADTPQNKILLTPEAHDLKTKIQSVALTLMRADNPEDRITPTQAKMLAMRWRELTSDGIGPVDSTGRIDITNAKAVAARWQKEQETVDYKWGDVWNEMKNLKDFGEQGFKKIGMDPHGVTAAFVREFVKGGAGTLSFGYIPYEMDDDYKNGAAKVSAWLGATVGSVVGFVAPMKLIGAVGGAMAVGLRKIGLLAKGANAIGVGKTVAETAGFAGSVGKAVNTAVQGIPKIESSAKWVRALHSAGVFATYGQLSKEGLVGELITGEEKQFGQQFIHDVVLGGAMGRFANMAQPAKESLKVAGTALAADIVLRADEPGWTIHSALESSLTMGGLQYLFLRGGSRLAPIKLSEGQMAGYQAVSKQFTPKIGQATLAATKYDPALRARVEKEAERRGIDSEALQKEIDAATVEMEKKIASEGVRVGHELDYESTVNNYIKNLVAAREVYIKTLPPELQIQARSEDLISMIKFAYKNEPIQERLTYALRDASAKGVRLNGGVRYEFNDIKDNIESLGKLQEMSPGVMRIPLSGTEISPQIAANVERAYYANQAGLLGLEGFAVRNEAKGRMINARLAAEGKKTYLSPENYIEVWMPIYETPQKTGNPEWIKIGNLSEAAHVQDFNGGTKTPFDSVAHNKDTVGNSMANMKDASGKNAPIELLRVDLEYLNPETNRIVEETGRGTHAAVIQIHQPSFNESAVFNEVWRQRQLERASLVDSSVNMRDADILGKEGVSVDWIDYIANEFKVAIETGDFSAINKNWGKNTVTPEMANEILGNPDYSLNQMFDLLKKSPTWKKNKIVIEAAFKPTTPEGQKALASYLSTAFKNIVSEKPIEAEVRDLKEVADKASAEAGPKPEPAPKTQYVGDEPFARVIEEPAVKEPKIEEIKLEETKEPTPPEVPAEAKEAETPITRAAQSVSEVVKKAVTPAKMAKIRKTLEGAGVEFKGIATNGDGEPMVAFSRPGEAVINYLKPEEVTKRNIKSKMPAEAIKEAVPEAPEPETRRAYNLGEGEAPDWLRGVWSSTGEAPNMPPEAPKMPQVEPKVETGTLGQKAELDASKEQLPPVSRTPQAKKEATETLGDLEGKELVVEKGAMEGVPITTPEGKPVIDTGKKVAEAVTKEKKVARIPESVAKALREKTITQDEVRGMTIKEIKEKIKEKESQSQEEQVVALPESITQEGERIVKTSLFDDAPGVKTLDGVKEPTYRINEQGERVAPMHDFVPEARPDWFDTTYSDMVVTLKEANKKLDAEANRLTPERKERTAKRFSEYANEAHLFEIERVNETKDKKADWRNFSRWGNGFEGTNNAIKLYTNDPVLWKKYTKANMLKRVKALSKNGIETQDVIDGWKQFLTEVTKDIAKSRGEKDFVIPSNELTDLKWEYDRLSQSSIRREFKRSESSTNRVDEIEQFEYEYVNGAPENYGKSEKNRIRFIEKWNNQPGLAAKDKLAPEALEIVTVIKDKNNVYPQTARSGKTRLNLNVTDMAKHGGFLPLGFAAQGGNMLSVRYSPELVSRYKQMMKTNPKETIERYLNEGESLKEDVDIFYRVYDIDVQKLPKHLAGTDVNKRTGAIHNRYDEYTGEDFNDRFSLLTLKSNTLGKNEKFNEDFNPEFFDKESGDPTKTIEKARDLQEMDGIILIKPQLLKDYVKGFNYKEENFKTGLKFLIDSDAKGRIIHKGHAEVMSPAWEQYLIREYGLTKEQIEKHGIISFDSNEKIGPGFEGGKNQSEIFIRRGDVYGKPVSAGINEGGVGVSFLRKIPNFGSTAADMTLPVEARKSAFEKFNELLDRSRGKDDIAQIVKDYKDTYGIDVETLFFGDAGASFSLGGGRLALQKSLQKLTKKMIAERILFPALEKSSRAFYTPSIKTMINGEYRHVNNEEIMMGRAKMKQLGVSAGDEVIVLRDPSVFVNNVLVLKVVDGDAAGRTGLGRENAVVSQFNTRIKNEGDYDADTMLVVRVDPAGARAGGLPKSFADSIKKFGEKAIPILPAVPKKKSYATFKSIMESMESQAVGIDQVNHIAEINRIMDAAQANKLKIVVYKMGTRGAGGPKSSIFEIYSGETLVKTGEGPGSIETIEVTPEWGPRNKQKLLQSLQYAVDSKSSASIVELVSPNEQLRAAGGDRFYMLRELFLKSSPDGQNKKLDEYQARAVNSALETFQAPFKIEKLIDESITLPKFLEENQGAIELLEGVKSAGGELTPYQQSILTALKDVKSFDVTREQIFGADKAAREALRKAKESGEIKITKDSSAVKDLKHLFFMVKEFDLRNPNKDKIGKPEYDKNATNENKTELKELFKEYFRKNEEQGNYTDQDLVNIAYWAAESGDANIGWGYMGWRREGMLYNKGAKWVKRMYPLINADPKVAKIYHEAAEGYNESIQLTSENIPQPKDFGPTTSIQKEAAKNGGGEAVEAVIPMPGEEPVVKKKAYPAVVKAINEGLVSKEELSGLTNEQMLEKINAMLKKKKK